MEIQDKRAMSKIDKNKISIVSYLHVQPHLSHKWWMIGDS